MYQTKIVSVQDLKPGDTISAQDGELMQFRSLAIADGHAVMTLYRQDAVSKALVQVDARIERIEALQDR